MKVRLNVPRPSNPFVGAVMLAKLDPSLRKAASKVTPDGLGGNEYVLNTTPGTGIDLPLGVVGVLTVMDDNGRLRIHIPPMLVTLGQAAGMSLAGLDNARDPATNGTVVWLPKNTKLAIPVTGVGDLRLAF